MRCDNCNCDKDQLYPIDPRGSKNRRWVCSDCIKRYPYPISKWIYLRGQRASLKLQIKIMCNKILDKLTQ